MLLSIMIFASALVSFVSKPYPTSILILFRFFTIIIATPLSFSFFPIPHCLHSSKVNCSKSSADVMVIESRASVTIAISLVVLASCSPIMLSRIFTCSSVKTFSKSETHPMGLAGISFLNLFSWLHPTEETIRRINI